MKKAARMKDHVIICGGGNMGQWSGAPSARHASWTGPACW